MTATSEDPRTGAGLRAPGTLVLDRLTRHYAGGGARAAVSELSLALRPGELLALVGASGSGKTTTLRMVAGYERPDVGRILLDGEDITRVPSEKRGFGMVFQHYALFPHMSVEQNVAFGLEARGVAKGERLARARRALEGVGLGGKGGRAVQQLSGGEQQRVALARATVIEPRVLLLDEPLSNLDPALRASTREELRALLHRLGVTALFVTHDQEDAFAVADRVAVLQHGRLLQVGTPEALYDRPASRGVAEFVGHAALLPARREEGDAVVTVGGVAQRAAAAAPAEGPPEVPRPGGELLAVLRPEQLYLASPGTGDAWPGTVRVRRFAGGHVVYQVALADGTEVEVSSTERGAREGDTVRLRLGPTPVALVPA